MKFAKTFLILQIATLSFCCVSCGENKDEPKVTKIAVFADSQLTNTITSGATENSIPYFKQHLELAKKENVDVIMIPGDLVNNAAVSYYLKANAIIKDVYGEDKTKWPEFVCSMGNHEWYTNDASEKEEPTAISLFKKYAHIDSNNVRKKSESPVTSQNNTSANYYKVVNGIPFVSISCTNNSGLLMYQEIEELESWFKEISELKSVKQGGPIYVAYHYPIKGLTYTFGQGGTIYSESLDNILKKYPQVVLFTGDTHFSGANERTINQVNYTNINLGSSCYSRHVSRSATMDSSQSYYNTIGSTKDQITGEAGLNYEKTPHVHFVNVDEKGNAKYTRYFSTEDSNSPKKLGLEWEICAGVKKEDFTYTNARFLDKSWANKMYGKDGLSWSVASSLSANLTTDGLNVSFPDVTDFNYCEHYKITVEGDTKKEFDFVSNYYKWEDNSHTNNFLINKSDLPIGSNYKITVKAYDYFDNLSLNYLTNQ